MWSPASSKVVRRAGDRTASPYPRALGPQSLLRELLHQQRNAHLSLRKQYERREEGAKHRHQTLEKTRAHVNVQSLPRPSDTRPAAPASTRHREDAGDSLTVPKAWGSAPRTKESCLFPSQTENYLGRGGQHSHLHKGLGFLWPVGTERPSPAPRSPASGPAPCTGCGCSSREGPT